MPSADHSLQFNADTKMVADEKKLSLKRKWTFKAGPVSGRLSAEAAYQLKVSMRLWQGCGQGGGDRVIDWEKGRVAWGRQGMQ